MPARLTQDKKRQTRWVTVAACDLGSHRQQGAGRKSARNVRISLNLRRSRRTQGATAAPT